MVIILNRLHHYQLYFLPDFFVASSGLFLPVLGATSRTRHQRFVKCLDWMYIFGRFKIRITPLNWRHRLAVIA
jgi:hypothetical protein